MSSTNYDIVTANQFVGGGISSAVSLSPFARTYYVDGSNGSDGNNGLEPDQAFASIGAAISASTSGRGDHIVVAPGTYTVTSAVNPKARNVIRAAVVNPRVPSVKITGAVADLVTVDVDGVVLQGLEILAGDNANANLINVANNADVNGLFILDCVLNGADKTSVAGVAAIDGTNDTTGLVIKNCLFRDLTGTCIDIGGLGIPYGYIGYNQIAIDVNGGKGISIEDTSAFATGKGYVIEHNNFTGFDATGDEVGIYLVGTEDTTAAGIIKNNYFAYCATAAITADKTPRAIINNYVGDTGTGGTLVDCGTP